MPVTPGTRLGVYEITAAIGAGGMGEVYRATDTNLKRQVAMKVLPASVAGDANRLARFQREAEVETARASRAILSALACAGPGIAGQNRMALLPCQHPCAHQPFVP